MAPPPMTTNFPVTSVVEPSFNFTLPVFPTITPRRGMNSSDKQGKNDDKALAITTIENSVTCGWYAGAVSQAFICSEPLTCATNTDSIIACSSENAKIEFCSICLNVHNGSPRDCAIEGVLCCNSVYPSCMTLVWTASPTRSLVQCAAMESTWLMQDYPYELETSSTSDTSSSSSSSSKSTPSSETSQPSASSGMSSTHSTSDKSSSNSQGISSASSHDSDTITPSPGSGPSTFPVTTAAPSPTASILPVEQTPSRGLSTGAKAGIGVGAGAGMLVILALIGLLAFKKYKSRATARSDEPPHPPPQNISPGGGGLQDNPNGDLPSEIAPPARVNRSLVSGWAVGTSSNDDYDLMEGASEVPVDMRGQGVGAVELAGSPVEMSTLDEVSQSQYEEYQTQASQYQRYSQIGRVPWSPMSYQGPSHGNESWSAASN